MLKNPKIQEFLFPYAVKCWDNIGLDSRKLDTITGFEFTITRIKRPTKNLRSTYINQAWSIHANLKESYVHLRLTNSETNLMTLQIQLLLRLWIYRKLSQSTSTGVALVEDPLKVTRAQCNSHRGETRIWDMSSDPVLKGWQAYREDFSAFSTSGWENCVLHVMNLPFQFACVPRSSTILPSFLDGQWLQNMGKRGKILK